MSQFQGTKCDECGRVQGEANHWQKMCVGYVNDKPEIVLVGDLGDPQSVKIERKVAPAKAGACRVEVHDLCGPGCAIKHIANMLDWNV